MNITTRASEHIQVRAHEGASARGTLSYRGMDVPCALGRSGVSTKTAEGDGITPVGKWPLQRILYRADRVDGIVSQLPSAAIDPSDGWCDDPADPCYNQPVTLPHAASHERMWRDDSLYDIVVVLGFNDSPIVAGAGSAIFFHLAAADYSPTEGCIAIARGHMLKVLKTCGTGTTLEVLS